MLRRDWQPKPIFCEERVGQEDEFSRDSDEGGFFGGAFCYEPSEERLHTFAGTGRRDSGEIEYGSYGGSAAVDDALAYPFAGFIGNGCKAAQGAGLLSGDGSEFAEAGDQCHGHDRTKAGYGDKNREAPGKPFVCFDLREAFLLDRLYGVGELGDALLEMGFEKGACCCAELVLQRRSLRHGAVACCDQFLQTFKGFAGLWPA